MDSSILTAYDAKLLCPAATFLRLLVDDIHDVHRAVTDIRQHMNPAVLIDIPDYRRVTLREDRTACDPDAVFGAVEFEPDTFLFEHIFSEGLPLGTDPSERQAACDMHIGFRDMLLIELSGDGHQGQKVIIFIDRLVRCEFLMAFADPVPSAFVFQNVSGKDSF